MKKFIVDFEGEEEIEETAREAKAIFHGRHIHVEIYMVPWSNAQDAQRMYKIYKESAPLFIKYKMNSDAVQKNAHMQRYALQSPKWAIGFVADHLKAVGLEDGGAYWWHIIMPDDMVAPHHTFPTRTTAFISRESDFDYWEVLERPT